MFFRLVLVSFLLVCFTINYSQNNRLNSKDSLFYSNQIDSLAFVDQEIRTGIYAKLSRIYFKYKLDSTLNKNDSIYKKALILRNKSIQSDLSNVHYLIEMIEEFGYPSELLVGRKSNSNAETILLHFDADSLNKTLQPILDLALKKKEISPEFYSWIIDRHRVNFGNQPIYFANLSSCEMYKLLDEEKKKVVFENRKEIGLKPLEYD